MNTIRNLKKMRTSALGTAAAAAALPALLFVGAGTAQADANPSFWGQNDIAVTYGGGGLDLFVTIQDFNNHGGPLEDCHYHSVGVNTTPPIPFDADAFPNGSDPAAPVVILAPQLGGQWNVTVTCNVTGKSASRTVIY